LAVGTTWPSTDASRVYTSHGTIVEVLDPKAGKVVGQITQPRGVHGIAITSEFGKRFITDGQSNRVTIFDLKTLAKSGEPQTGQNRFGLLRTQDQTRDHLQRPLQRLSEIVEIDAANTTVLRHASFSPCESPPGLAIDLKNKQDLLVPR
jgi:DNA-binding beta-propeller fold protein YncE